MNESKHKSLYLQLTFNGNQFTQNQLLSPHNQTDFVKINFGIKRSNFQLQGSTDYVGKTNSTPLESIYVSPQVKPNTLQFF